MQASFLFSFYPYLTELHNTYSQLNLYYMNDRSVEIDDYEKKEDYSSKN